MDPTTLAATAIAAAMPYVEALGKAAAGAAGKSIWDWVKSKLTSEASQEAVRDLEVDPTAVDNRNAVEAALSKFLRSDPNAFADLASLLRQAGPPPASVVVTATHNTVAAGRDIVGSTIEIAGQPKPIRRP
jgi:hypothetical protein